MDESVEMFRAEQRRMAQEGGPTRAFLRSAIQSVLRLGIFAVLIFLLLAGLDLFPRNADYSMKLAYYGPILAFIAIGSALLLRKRTFRKSAFSASAWAFILMAIIAIAAGAIDAIGRN